MLKSARLQLIFEINHNHRILIVIIGNEFRHKHTPVLFKPSYQIMLIILGFSTASTPAINGARNERPATEGSEFNCFVRSH
jgi:hypothetical protein